MASNGEDVSFWNLRLGGHGRDRRLGAGEKDCMESLSHEAARGQLMIYIAEKTEGQRHLR
jgi:hypothetical protein